MKILSIIIVNILLTGCTLMPKPKSDAESFIPHTLDLTQTAWVLSDGGIELNPVGWPGVAFAKIGTEVIARQYRNFGRPDICYSLAMGSRSGGWAGFAATAAGLLGATTIGMIAAGIALPILMWNYTAATANITCYQITEDPFDVNIKYKNPNFGNK